MAVDRGGLNYGIKTRDEFSTVTKLFRKELASSKAAFRDFQAELSRQRSSSRALRETAEASRAMAKAARDQAREVKNGTKPMTEAERLEKKRAATLRSLSDQLFLAKDAEVKHQRELLKAAKAQDQAAKAADHRTKAELRAQQQLAQARVQGLQQQEALAQKLANAHRKEQALRDKKDPRLQATRQLNEQLFRESVLREKIVQLQARAKAQFAAGDFLGGSRTISQAKDLEKSMANIDKSSKGLLFTFRRLVGVLALFTLVREAVSAFRDLVASGITFNDRIEAARIGIAGLVATLGDVRDATGESVDNAQELELALGIADKQVKALRQDSLRTVATFEELLTTFQTAVGPGLAAGLDLDEVRKLTVDISQAAAALGVPQNQLAEEIRSLLSGTIQARTTRIATALGITNEDIRRLRESGELFEFLEERFAGFAQAAEKQARSTLSGIRQLITGATSELLGDAAQPLFEELVALGNEFFDEVLTIQDEAGNILPNPKAVEAFQDLFEALRDGVKQAREFAQSVGFEGLDQIVDSIASGLRGVIGFVKGLIAPFVALLKTLGAINKIIGITAKDVGAIAGILGVVAGASVAWRFAIAPIVGVLTRINGLLAAAKVATVENGVASATWATRLGAVATAAAKAAAILLAIPLAIQVLSRAFTGLDVTFRDSFTIIFITAKEIFTRIVFFIENSFKNLANRIVRIFVDPIGAIGDALEDLFSVLIGAARGLGFDDMADQLEEGDKALRKLQRSLGGGKGEEFSIFSKESLAEDKKAFEDTIAGIDKEFGELVADIQARSGELSLEEQAAEFQKFAKRFEEAFGTGGAGAFISTADKPINELAESLAEVNKELLEAKLLFEQAGRSAGVGGFAGQVEGIFNKEEIANAERLRGIRAELATTEERIAALRAKGVGDDEGALVTLLRDQKDLQDAINIALELGNTLAATRAATEALNVLPGLQEENALLSAQVAQERALTAVKVNRAGAAQEALVAAQASLDNAQIELGIARQKNQVELETLQAQIARAPIDERHELLAVLSALRERKELEEEILELRIQQLRKAEEEAALVANGSLTQGLREGFMQFAEEFSSTFQAGVNIARESTQALAQFISQSIVDAFDPTKEGTILERFARFLQQIAGIILQNLAQLAISKLISSQTEQATELATAEAAALIKVTAAQTAAGIDIATAQAVAAIRVATAGGLHGGGLVGFHDGGKVHRKGNMRHSERAARRAVGMSRGGRPPGLHPRDTVPAFLEPGEFVIRKSVVDSVGAKFFSDINGGNFPVAQAAAAQSAAGPTSGMARGGQVQQRRTSRRDRDEEGRLVVVPAVVARDREMDKFTAGGRNAFMSFVRDNAGTISNILDRGASRR